MKKIDIPKNCEYESFYYNCATKTLILKCKAEQNGLPISKIFVKKQEDQEWNLINFNEKIVYCKSLSISPGSPFIFASFWDVDKYLHGEIESFWSHLALINTKTMEYETVFDRESFERNTKYSEFSWIGNLISSSNNGDRLYCNIALAENDLRCHYFCCIHFNDKERKIDILYEISEEFMFQGDIM